VENALMECPFKEAENQKEKKRRRKKEEWEER